MPPHKDQSSMYEPGMDPRLDFLFDVLTRSLRIKVDKWVKMYALEESRQMILDFFEKEDVPNFLLITLNAGGLIIVLNTFPNVLRSKSMYFMKKDPTQPILKDDPDYKKAIIYADLPQQPLESLVTFIEAVAAPLINNRQNQDQWPETVISDVKHHTQEISGVLYSVQGQLKGKTMLPMPLSFEAVEQSERQLREMGSSEIDLQLKTQIESLVMKWSQQINEVLKQDSAKALENGAADPTPFEELIFWENRVQDLQCIYDQLNEPKVKKIANILEASGSTYWTTFKNDFRNVVASLAEAQDILAYLKPLKKHLDNVTSCLYEDLKDHIRPMMHCVCLIWSHSKYYCNPARIIVLLRELCNLMIDLSRNFLGGSAIFQLEPEEALVKVNIVMENMQYFRELYDEHRSKLPAYFPTGSEPRTWDFLPQLVFARFDKFMARVKELKDIFESSVEYVKLDRVDFGGSKGRYLTAQVQEINNQFQDFYQKFNSLSYDVTDPADDSFEPDLNEFKEAVIDIDQRLATIIRAAFDDCHTAESCAKLIMVLGSVLDRPTIKAEVDDKYVQYLKLIEEDLDHIKRMFDEQIIAFGNPEDRREIGKIIPPYSSSIQWAQGMLTRIRDQTEQLKSLELPLEKFDEELKVLTAKEEEMVEILENFIQQTNSDWRKKVNKEGSQYLTDHLITREDSTTIKINFKPELTAVLKEVKYMKQFGFDNIPSAAQHVYDRRDELRKNKIHLDQVASAYNRIQSLANPQELALMQNSINKVNEKMKPGEESLRWSDGDRIWPFVQELIEPVKALLAKLLAAQANVRDMKKLIEAWEQSPLYQRKDGRKDQLLDLGPTADERRMKRYKEIEEASEKITGLVAANKLLFRDDEVKKEDWKKYLMYLDKIVMAGMVKAVAVSFGYLADHTSPDLTPSPFMEVKMELNETEITFHPSLSLSRKNSLLAIFETVLSNIFHQAALVKRVKSSGSANYLKSVESNEELADMRRDIINRIDSVVNKIYEYIGIFDSYAWLWEGDRKEYLEQFLKYGHQLTPEELEAKQLGEAEPPEIAPTLEQFKEIIDKFETLYLEVEKFPVEQVFDKWLKLDLRPFRQAVMSTVKRWSLMFKQYLINSVVGGLSELENFIKEAELGLNQTIREGDLQTLISVMAMLQKIKDKEGYYDNMFEPIKQYIELLKMYDYELPENVFVQLEELPHKWTALKKLAISTKHTVAPMIAQEMSKIRKNISDFDQRQQEYRERFKRYDFFNENAKLPYKQIDNTNREILALEKEYEEICAAAGLFEVHVPDPKALKQCRRELRFVKHIWDYKYIVDSLFADWSKTPWKNINVENMDIECKRMAKEVKAMDKDVKNWGIYVNLENKIRNMISSLKSVSELQNPAIRERHWQELMAQTKVKFNLSDSTTLADLIDLNLHKYEEEVKNIVDKAVKEASMEKTIKELEATWKNQEYEFEQHPRTQLNLIKASEELIEMLEENQVQLQNIAQSKYIDFFREEVEYWQNRLFNADQVLEGLNEVQRTWGHLEPIFIATEDIRKNLPQDAKRFDQIDKDFRELLKKISTTKNVMEATNQPGLIPELERLQKELAICEKALADYLETKRLAFPRFYFVSSVDLLDILSNGSNPPAVAKHLTKLFDAMSKLEFKSEQKSKPKDLGLKVKPPKKLQSKRDSSREDETDAVEDTDSSKVAVAMWAKDGEKISMHQTCVCTGPVEQWLRRLELAQWATVRHYFNQAVNSYEDKPRDQWIFDFPAQTALCGTQIWWTTEVNIAFTKLEDGYENALKDYFRKQVNQLSILIGHLLGKLTGEERQKIMTICTIDVHSRDVVGKMIQSKVESSQAFQWQSQLRHRWDDDEADCYANICDAQFKYWYEYLGNTPRLVITPLTDRCYITLTQSLHLILGGAPAGPAGTGKTETTKDLGRALGMMVYVFNCSEQMDYKSIGNIYKGLAQTGAWGCFDEFNRISIAVLSVVAVQVKTIQDAIRDKKSKFNFLGEEIKLRHTVGLFITMNPGYAGRTELPENLKTLFRPCAMVVPDFELIAEIMLVAEGFQEAKVLAHKFITLYTLCKELLSKQDHYDWGLRAIKSVLVVAGGLKRSDPDRPEDQILMRALRDFNIPKIVTDDVPVFMGLIGDLFPSLDVPRKRDLDFEKQIKIALLSSKLQPEDSFVLKVVQLQELIDVRHSVFILGNAGTGKSTVWKTLYKTHQIMKHKPYFNDLNPKAVTNNELFGFINPSTREWKDGLLSVLMREQANMTGDGPKWIVLDGDIDPMWIESLNTVMDDNKVMTLASNERIALTPMMRLLFEIYTLRVATPATVSRAGILYLNPADLGWNPFVSSWVDRRDNASERASLLLLFEKYVPTLLEAFKTRFKRIIPISEIAQIELVCNLLECMFTPENCPPDSAKEVYELYFVFCLIWGFGSALFQDQIMDHRIDFSKWFQNEFKHLKFPGSGTVFDFYIDPESKKLEPWNDIIPPFELDPDVPLQATLVHTGETTRVKFFMDVLMPKGIPVMLVGNAGSGKTVVVGDKLLQLPESYAVTNVPFNFYTTSEMLQRVLEKPLEKKAGRNYGPQGNKKLIYFIDDMNMPMVDTYGTVQPHTIIRQHLDYRHWYDRAKLTLKEINNVQYVACMNPTAGSFTINPRLQRHFATFAVGFPGTDALKTIYNSILQQHLASHVQKFGAGVQRAAGPLVNSALALHQKVAATFLPTAVKFHYMFNLRDLSNIFQGLLFSTFECLPEPQSLIRLWLHEAARVYEDKLVDEDDIMHYRKLVNDNVKKGFEDVHNDESFLLSKPNIYSHFANGLGDPKYMPVTDFGNMTKILQDALKAYNDFYAVMDLVLFEDAIKYVLKISRILESPRGNALCVGVGGSGKQSLARLAAYLSSLDVFQVALKKGYGPGDLKTDLAALYIKAGQKNIGTMFLMTDAEVAEEVFLVLVNDLLASGEIPEVLPDDEVENIITSMRTEVKTVGLQDTRENCWRYFIDRVRKTLKVVLCFSPVGSTLRNRSRKFPALTNCTQIIWFHEWPEEALHSVSQRFVKKIEALPEQLCKSIAEFMAYCHTSVNEMSKVYLQNERRYNYTTPKSFLELIQLYGNLVTTKKIEALKKADRLESGLVKLESCAQQVEELKKVLAVQEKVLKEKNEKADALIKIVGRETNQVSVEKENAAVEERKVAITATEVAKIKEICRVELEKAEPALKRAYEALKTLDKQSLQELRSFPSPAEAVQDVVAAAFILWVGTRTGKIPKDISWKAAKADMMADSVKFKQGLEDLDKEKITMAMVDAMKPMVSKPHFTYEIVVKKSVAAAGICLFVLNILSFNDVFQDVAPKRRALNEATDQLNKATERVKFLKHRIKELEDKLTVLTKEFEQAMAAKVKCQKEADTTAKTIDLANRLVGGLGAEKQRWISNVEKYRASTKTIPGDMLLVAAFVSYVGCFTKKYRIDLLQNQWIPHLNKLEPPVPMSPTVDPLAMLTDDAEIAQWNNQGLPADRMSAENATILTNSQRWPLMIDPQLQGIKWIKNMYGSKLKVVRLGQKGYLDVIEEAISKGSTVLIENIGENVDPVLQPVLTRNLIKKGTAIRIGDKEIDYNKKFRLILQTKLANPHYKPEMQAQTALVNFTVTREGLEDQLLAEVVKVERPDLEAQKSQLTKQQNEFKILLKRLEDELLNRLQSAKGKFLDDSSLVENLETTKRTAGEVEIKAKEAVTTSAKIDAARELYRPAASRASLLYFILNDLYKISPMYQFSLKAFSTVFQNAMRSAPTAGEVAKRIENLIDSITFAVWQYTSRGLFESDKLIFTAQMAFQIGLAKNAIQAKDLDFLLRFPITPNLTSPVDFITNNGWGAIISLSKMDDFRNLERDIEGSSKRWRKIVDSETPEREKFPQEWKNKTGVQRLCILRALRPDRMTYAISVFIEETLGGKFIRSRRIPFTKSFEESSNTTPIFFILSPGVDPLKDVESLGKKLGFTIDTGNFHNVSLGQGQEVVAENALEIAGEHGHWVILQNIHLVASWLSSLEKKLEFNWEKSSKDYRVFLSAEPPPLPEAHIIPQGILESSIKITNEPPTGMLANIHKALDNFNQEALEQCSKELEFKAVIFSLCYFHAVVAERRKFGTQGWNRVYPFSNGDLTISANVLYNYLEANSKVPWEDLRYLFGEIMYGGHITDDWDRRLCRSYLEEFMIQELLDGEISYAIGFPAPPSTDFQGYHQYVDENLPEESPTLYGLHPNAEIGFLTVTSENLFKVVFELQPRDAGGSGGAVVTKEEKIKQILDDIMDKLPDPFNMSEIQGRAEDKTPFVIVALQECERMNMLTVEMRRQLKELDLGLKGELTISADMEELGNCVFSDIVPPSWTKLAYPSALGLSAWYADLLLRARELESWSTDFYLPSSVWLGGFFNPQSFLTAIMQTTARKQELPLDKMCLQCEVTKKYRDDFTVAPREGACIHGLYMEGARWDIGMSCVTDSKLKELYPSMPVIILKAITQDKMDMRNMYECPVYKTRQRGPTYVWTFNLRSRERPTKWVLAGVALLLQA